MSLYGDEDGDEDGVEEAPEVAMPPEGSEGVETGGDVEDFDAEAAAAEAVDDAEDAEADDGEEGDDGGGGLLATVLAIGLLVFGILLGGDQQQRPGGV